MGKGIARPVLVAGVCLGALFLTASTAAAAGSTFHAAPLGEGIACSEGLPCEIGVAVEKAGDGDSVVLVEGEYTLPPLGLLIEDEIDIGGTIGDPAVLETTSTRDVEAFEQADPTLHDMRIQGGGSLRLGSGTAERVFVAHAGAKLAAACDLDKGTALLNSVCWTLEGAAKGVDAIEITASGEKQGGTAVLRNVTAIANNLEANAIHASSNASAVLIVDAANVIARSSQGTDLFAELGNSGLPKALIDIVNSDFGDSEDDPGADAAVTPLGTSGNVSAAPTFLSPATGDFHVGGDSPTLDGGIDDGSIGVVDLEGFDRSQAKCVGAAQTPDMGAFERAPTDPCPVVPPPQVLPEPRKPVFRILSLVLNKGQGRGKLLVEVPEGGGTLSLTGSGVKLVRRTAPVEGGVITLPIQTWAITKVRLAKFGKTKVHLKVIFSSKHGGLEEWLRGVQLRKQKS
jgi:hypothetical protein